MFSCSSSLTSCFMWNLYRLRTQNLATSLRWHTFPYFDISLWNNEIASFLQKLKIAEKTFLWLSVWMVEPYFNAITYMHMITGMEEVISAYINKFWQPSWTFYIIQFKSLSFLPLWWVSGICTVASS